MKKLPKELVTLIAAVIIIGIIIVAKTAISSMPKAEPEAPQVETTASPTNDFDAPATIDPVPLPTDLEATIGFMPKQLDMLTQHYALAKYETGQNSIVYYYQTNIATNGERFMVICSQMSEEDYAASIPTKNVTTESHNGVTLTYAERWLYSVPNDFEMIDPIAKGIEEGTMEIEYGNTLEEMIKKNCFYWYDNGIKYEIQVRNQNLPYENLFEIAKSIIDVKV